MYSPRKSRSKGMGSSAGGEALACGGNTVRRPLRGAQRLGWLAPTAYTVFSGK